GHGTVKHAVGILDGSAAGAHPPTSRTALPVDFHMVGRFAAHRFFKWVVIFREQRRSICLEYFSASDQAFGAEFFRCHAGHGPKCRFTDPQPATLVGDANAFGHAVEHTL